MLTLSHYGKIDMVCLDAYFDKALSLGRRNPTMKTRLSPVIAALLLLGLSHFAAAGADFYVAPNGKDSSPGTAAEPFATLANARDAVRAKVAAGLRP